ncbi:MAG: hypothetical protein U0930_06295 [Pirellulales bacterium]
MVKIAKITFKQLRLITLPRNRRFINVPDIGIQTIKIATQAMIGKVWQSQTTKAI